MNETYVEQGLVEPLVVLDNLALVRLLTHVLGTLWEAKRLEKFSGLVLRDWAVALAVACNTRVQGRKMDHSTNVSGLAIAFKPL